MGSNPFVEALLSAAQRAVCAACGRIGLAVAGMRFHPRPVAVARCPTCRTEATVTA